jgi:5S rRNA maturation endonuclease (ribonuclease M5)
MVKERASITEVVQHFGGVELRRGKCRCPFHEDKDPSFSVKESDGIWTCFAGCGSGDAVDFVAKIKGIDLKEACDILADFYRIERTVSQGSQKRKPSTTANTSGGVDALVAPKPRIKQEPEYSPEQLEAFRKQRVAYCKTCHGAAYDTDYFAKRGLTAETIKRFYLGYDATEKCVVLPYSSTLDYYFTRSVSGREFNKPKATQAGAEPIYNPKALSGRGVVFVTEGQFCAMSIEQAGGRAVSICGTNGWTKLIAEFKTKPPKCTLVLCLDNDAKGREAQAKFAQELKNLKVKFIEANLTDDYKDPNELLVADPGRLTELVKAAITKAKRQFTTLKCLFKVSDLQVKDLPPIKWIVEGLLPEGLALLAAPSKYGKSWMMLGLCEAVTEGKAFLEHKTHPCDCVYISLEDSERRFKERFNDLAKGRISKGGFYGMVTAQSMANGLFDQLTELVETYPKIGLIIIDTFQKIRGGQGRNESVYAADYREMGEMKEFADKHRVCILLVHHMRKADDDGDVFNRISGSMAIMGASDTSWVLSRKKRGDTNSVLTVTGRDIKDKELVLGFDGENHCWQLIGNAEDEAVRKAREEYQNHPVIKTIKVLVDKHPQGWRGTSTDIKLQIYEQTGSLFTGSADTVGRAISKYIDRLAADGIEHSEERGKRHCFRKKSNTLYGYMNQND